METIIITCSEDGDLITCELKLEKSGLVEVIIIDEPRVRSYKLKKLGLDEFLIFLHDIFWFFGKEDECFTTSKSNLNCALEIINNISIPEDIQFVMFEKCGCNMGECRVITNTTKIAAKNYKDLMRRISFVQKGRFLYPPDGFCSIKKMEKITFGRKSFFKVNMGHDNIPTFVPCESDKAYVSVMYF